MEQQSTNLTPKAEATRQRILDAALTLFATKGYEATTMRDIAAAAECSLGLTYRYFVRKEELVLALYQRLATQFGETFRKLPPAPLAESFYRAMKAHFELMAPYREAWGSIFDAALNPRSPVGVLGENTIEIRRMVLGIFREVVTKATDAPKEPQAHHLTIILYGANLALGLFWLQDRSPDNKPTYELLAFTRDMIALLRPLLGLPPLSKAVARLAGIIEPVMGDVTPIGTDESIFTK
jgi:AcrR family transcriptional regulator